MLFLSFGSHMVRSPVRPQPGVLANLQNPLSNLPCQSLVLLAPQNTPDAEAAAVRLTTEAYQRGSNDNISCIVVAFKFDDLPPQLEPETTSGASAAVSHSDQSGAAA